MKTVRVKMTPARMERLLAGKPVRFKALSLGADPDVEIEIVLEDDSDAWDRFEKVLNKFLNSVLNKVEKTADTILK